MGVLDHDDAGVDHGADGDGDAPEGHDVDADPLRRHHDERHEDADGQGHDGDEPTAKVEQERHGHQPDDQQLLQQAGPQARDGTFDERRAVVGDLHLDAFREPGLDFVELGLDVADHLPRARAVADDDDASHGLAFAVPLRNAPTHLRPHADAGDVLHQDR